MLKIFSFVLIFVISSPLYAASYKNNKRLSLDLSENPYKTIHKFKKYHQEYFKQVCKPGDEAKYYKLLKEYRGGGLYLPKLKGKVDRSAIILNLHHFKKKLKHISDIKKRLKTFKSLPKYKLIKADLDKVLKQLLDLKKDHHQEIREDKREKILNKSRQLLVKLNNLYVNFMDQVFFLKSYRFPNDYLSYREKYESIKDSSKKRTASNKTFFFRRIVEDGAFDPDHTRGDKFLRTTLDTLYIAIQKEKDFISENVRFDLKWVLKAVKSHLSRPVKAQMDRMDEWYARTKKQYDFYRDIVKVKNAKKAQKLVDKNLKATKKLKEYVYKKQAQTYQFWMKQPELMKALYSLESILVNEVGVIDGKYGLERQAVTEVALNRYFDPVYSQLKKSQGLVKHLPNYEMTKKQKWLNVLFRVGEFSFTYYYIGASAKTFCPDMSKRGKNVRAKNLKIILKGLQAYDGSFKAMRYFSRVSMLGKIDMSSVWTQYKRMPEMPGFKSLGQRKLSRLYMANKYQYLYSFLDRRNTEYVVVEINKKVYAMRWIKGRSVFFDYRNPHLFTYFQKK